MNAAVGDPYADCPDAFVARGWRLATLPGDDRVVVWDGRSRYLARVDPALVTRLHHMLAAGAVPDGATLEQALAAT